MSRFVLTIVTIKSEHEAIRALRAALKVLLRRFGFRCTDLREIKDDDS
jgi:hypothetical protein